ncbi:hypothetical protein EDD21DRAFT_317216 [Dissophora ornata]|nr:hypothetical protein EDD21DRAFT_317216 [Dissophora ornata]
MIGGVVIGSGCGKAGNSAREVTHVPCWASARVLFFFSTCGTQCLPLFLLSFPCPSSCTALPLPSILTLPESILHGPRL